MEWMYVLYMLLMMAFAATLRLICCFNWTKTDTRFRFKKILDVLVSLFIYIFVVFSHYASLDQSKLFFWSSIATAVCAFYVLFGFYLNQIASFSTVPDKAIRGKNFVYILVSLFFALVSAGSILNYVSYMIWPDFYNVPDCLDFAEIAFEFFYYTFTLIITYSGTSINAVHSISKIIQIVEICVFYVVFGVSFMELVVKAKNAVSFSQE